MGGGGTLQTIEADKGLFSGLFHIIFLSQTAKTHKRIQRKENGPTIVLGF